MINAPGTPGTPVQPSNADEDGSSRRDPLKAKIGLTLSALVVLGAGLAILQTEAGSNESNSARETTRVAVRAMRANVLVSSIGGLQADVDAERAFVPFRRPLTASTPSLTTAAGLPSNAAATAKEVTSVQGAVPDLGVAKLLVPLQVDAQRQTLKQRAFATTRITWNTRSTQYTTALAILAVALFLVGFGLVADGSIRIASFGMGVVVGLFIAVWATWLYFLPIPSTPAATIDATAKGSTLAQNGRYGAAVTQFDRALSNGSDYAPAFTGRSRARLLAANPDYPLTRAFTDPTGAAIASANEDAQRALEVDGNRSLLSFGLVALTDFYRGQYVETVAATDGAVEINPGVPDVWLLRSAALVALGDQTGAGASLTRALGLLKGAEPSQQTRLLSSTYLSYLGWVRRNVSTQAAAAQQLADRTVASETAFTLGRTLTNTPPAKGTVVARELRYADGALTLTLVWRDLPEGTAVSAIEYERPLEAGAWAQPAQLALYATLGGTGTRLIRVPVERVCKPTRVRVDLYLDGARVRSQTGPGVAATC